MIRARGRYMLHSTKRVHIPLGARSNHPIQSHLHVTCSTPFVIICEGNARKPRSASSHISNVSLKAIICDSALGVVETCSKSHKGSLKSPTTSHGRSQVFLKVWSFAHTWDDDSRCGALHRRKLFSTDQLLREFWPKHNIMFLLIHNINNAWFMPTKC